MRAELCAEQPLEILELRVQCPDRRNEREHQLAACRELQLAGPALRGAAELGHQRGRMLPAGVPLALQKRLHPRDSEPMGVNRARVALKEREQDLAVHMAEQPKRSGPE